MTVPRALAATAALALLVAACPALASELPPQLQDVNESFRLLSTTYYHPVADQLLVDKAREALEDLARSHGARVRVAAIHASDGASATAALDDAIVAAAQSAHGSLTDYAYAAIGAMAKAVDDKYTVFFTPDDFNRFKAELDPEKISGIGVLIGIDAGGSIVITYVIPGTPAERAGIQNGDVIRDIDGKATKSLGTDDTAKEDAASKLLRGTAGSIVHLTIDRGGTAPLDVTIARSEVTPPSVISKMMPGNIGYVYVLSFGQETPAQFDQSIERLKTQGAKALVLDLRNDGGGYVESALEITQRFVAGKPLLTVEQRGAPTTTVTADSDQAWVDVPVTVLVNQYTASASEITAGALQDDGIASLIGARTYGKGVMQTLSPLADGAAIKITTAHYLTPSHRDINLKGIEPDVSVKEPQNSRFGDAARDPQLRAALDYLQKKIAKGP
jgi:carboxyl-terminal processing protease